MNSFRKRILIELAIAGILIIALAGGLLFFGTRISSLSADIALDREELARRSALVGGVAALKAVSHGKVEQYTNMLSNIVPRKDQLINLSRDLQSLATQSELEYSFSFSSETPPGGANLGAVAFRLTLRGELTRLFRFVETFRQFRYLAALDGFSVERKAGGAEMVTQGRVFFR